ncbi:hypothetical protein [Actinoplanes aureus]|uniref:PIN domain-containing protein n=1 Tax=Actinoplanes aureus TaxID=2792083 RepID=A0A931FZB2_9ACTN|nr:hypothetical protein [Actinoplanes aureus]MBG0564585.1 hypothetical protein [Actinoplanes aureus]
MTEKKRAVRLVLDASAVVGWVRGSVAVGELIAEIDDEYGAVILPLPCLVEAAHSTGMLQQAHLEILIGHRAVTLLADDPADWLALTTLRGILGSPDRASAAMLALDAGVDVLTRDASWYAGVAGGRIALQFDR